MANRKREVYKPKPMTEGKRNLIQGLLQEYDIQSADDIQEALKDLLSGTIQDMLETEMDNHLAIINVIATNAPSLTLFDQLCKVYYFEPKIPKITMQQFSCIHQHKDDLLS